MKKALMLWLSVVIVSSQVSAKDVHTFSCDDSDNGPLVVSPAGKTQFTWEKNGEKIFNRVFMDAYSVSRDEYVAFYCENNIIRYRLFDCDEERVAPFCKAEVSPLSVQQSPELIIDQLKVETSETLVDGDDYKFITHYLFKSATSNPITVTGLYFVNDVDDIEGATILEQDAAAQYEYTLVGPNSELFSGVTTTDGKLYFDLSENPLVVEQVELNIGIAAKPKANLESAGNSSIRWRLNPSLGSKGVEAQNASGVLAYGEVFVYPYELSVFSRGLSGLKISHFNPQVFLAEPSLSSQPFYRARVENLSSKNAAELKRVTLEMRVIGMQKQGGAFLTPSDFQLAEIGPDASEVGMLSPQIFEVEDTRNDSQSFSLRFDLNNFVVPANDSRGLEFRISNLVNDSVGEEGDDGAAIQMSRETFLDGSKLSLSQLEDARWVWTDFSDGNVSGERQDWRSGLNLDMNTRPILIRE